MADVDNLRIVVELVDEFSEEVDELIAEIEKLGEDIDELESKEIDLNTAFHYEEELQALEERLNLFEEETELELDVDIAEGEELAETVSKIEGLKDLDPHVTVDFDEEDYESVVTNIEDLDGESATVTVRFDRSETDTITDFIGDLKSESVDIDVGFTADEDETDFIDDVDGREVEATLGFTTEESYDEALRAIDNLAAKEAIVDVDFEDSGSLETAKGWVEDIDDEWAKVPIYFNQRSERVYGTIEDLEDREATVEVDFEPRKLESTLSEIEGIEDEQARVPVKFDAEDVAEIETQVEAFEGSEADIPVEFVVGRAHQLLRSKIDAIEREEGIDIDVDFEKKGDIDRIKRSVSRKSATMGVDFDVEDALDEVEHRVRASYSDIYEDENIPNRDPIELKAEFDVDRTNLDRALDSASVTRYPNVKFQPITEYVENAINEIDAKTATVPVEFHESGEGDARATIEDLDGKEVEVEVDFHRGEDVVMPPHSTEVAVEFEERHLDRVARKARQLEEGAVTIGVDFEPEMGSVERAIRKAEGHEAEVRAKLDPDFTSLREEIAAIEESTEVDLDATIHLADEIRKLNNDVRGLETEDIDIDANIRLGDDGAELVTKLEGYEEHELNIPVELEYEAALLDFYAHMEALEHTPVRVPVYFDAKNDPSEGIGEIDMDTAQAGALFGGEMPGFGAGESGRRRGGATSGLVSNIKELMGGLDDIGKGLIGRDHGGGREDRSRLGRGVSRVSRSLSDLSLSMSSVHNLFAAFIPLLFVFIGALPAAIGGMLALAAAALTAAGALAAIGGLGALGFAMAQSEGEGMPSAEDFKEIGKRLRESFFESFAPLAKQLAPVFQDGLRGLERLFDEIAQRGDALLQLRDEARAFGGFVLEYLPGLMARLAGMADQLSPVFGAIGEWLQNTDVVQGFIDMFYEALPAMAAFAKALIGALPMILKVSMGLLQVATIIISLISWVLQFADAIGISGEVLGVMLGVVLVLITALSVLGTIAGALNAIMMLLSSGVLSALVPSFLTAIPATLGLSGAFYALAAAIAATGIGAIIVALGILVGKLVMAKSGMDDLTSSLKDFDKQVSRTDSFNPYDPSGGGPQGRGRRKPGERPSNKTVNNYHASGSAEEDQMRMKKMQYDNDRARERRSKK
jgi:type III secretory pathway lipoprotein EscJ